MKYTNCSKNCSDYTVDCERFDCCECDYNPERIAYEQGYKDGAITKLENIKAEIKVNARGEYDFEGYCCEEKISIKEVNKIIDDYIAELKGENNG